MFFEHISTGMECRHIPVPKSSMLFAAGFLDKNNWSRDQTNLVTDHYTLVYILNGRAEYETEAGVVYKLNAGDYFQRIPGVMHTTRIDPASRYFEGFVAIGLNFFKAWNEAGLLPASPIVGSAGLSLERAEAFTNLRDFIGSACAQENADVILRCQSFLVRFFASLKSPHEEADAAMVKEACRMLESDFTQKCNWREFCKKHRCNYHSFRRKFKKEIGIPPMQYRVRRRLDRAVTMLQERCYNVSEIAWELGYSSPFEFSAQFKRCFGSAPSHFLDSLPSR